MKILLGNKHHIKAYIASVHEFGEIPEDVIHFSARANSFHVIFWKLLGFSTARYWTGNDPWMIREAVHFGVKCVSTFSLCPEVLKCDPNDYEDILSKTEYLVNEFYAKKNQQPTPKPDATPRTEVPADTAV